MKIGIIGNGFVGKATCTLSCKEANLLYHNINPELCSPKGFAKTLEDFYRNSS
tara:strand:- start:1920 stop:2078 length:159 start_codon:yes stop_codon:yes gene_type:complete